MAKQTINTGNEPNDRSGDSLRAAFTKINANFTELYTALGLDVGSLNIGAFEFAGSTLSTTDSTAIVIDQAVTVSSDLTVDGDIVASNINATTSFGLPVYATEAARDIAIPSPQPGMMIFVTSGEGAGLQVRGATQWNPVGGLTGV